MTIACPQDHRDEIQINWQLPQAIGHAKHSSQLQVYHMHRFIQSVSQVAQTVLSVSQETRYDRNEAMHMLPYITASHLRVNCRRHKTRSQMGCTALVSRSRMDSTEAILVWLLDRAAGQEEVLVVVQPSSGDVLHRHKHASTPSCYIQLIGRRRISICGRLHELYSWVCIWGMPHLVFDI